MARDTYIIRPPRPARTGPPSPTRDDKIKHLARLVLADVARRIDARPTKSHRS